MQELIVPVKIRELIEGKPYTVDEIGKTRHMG